MDNTRKVNERSLRCTVLWHDKPAADCNEALPLGNGRLGGMVFGGIGCEQIQVNEERVWYGGPMDRNNPSVKEKLPVIREVIKAGKIHEAECLYKQALSGTPFGMRIRRNARMNSAWRDGKLEKTQICSGCNTQRRFVYRNVCVKMQLEKTAERRLYWRKDYEIQL